MTLRHFFFAAFLGLFPAAVLAADGEDLSSIMTQVRAGEYQDAVATLSPLVEHGDADAQHLMGYLFENGFGVKRNLQRAVELYVMAARGGQADAQFALGELALEGDGIEKSAKTAAGWYLLAAKQEHALAKLRLGVLYAEGNGVDRDRQKALSYFEDAAIAGEPIAQRNLAIAYLSGDGVAQNIRKAAEWFERAAANGDPVANYNLGLLYQSGRIGPPDLKASTEKMRAGAEAGFAPAMVGLGLLLHESSETDELPVDWFERAAAAGDPQGRFLYAVSLAESDGRPQDIAGAIAQLDVILADKSLLDPEFRRQVNALKKSLLKELPKNRQATNRN
ncbi:tetratricopeptide repeat protein [Hyphococcus lacteus]|uniref:Tetratricopeptide repeat protein n=1 Tax=Hyphococcus lacteus TaxID=3143536 RepID=A0ABV3Z2E4_9PROT